MQFSPFVWLIPVPLCNDGIYWTSFRAIEEGCNQLLKSKRRAGRCVWRIQSKRSVTIAWRLQLFPLVWLIPVPLCNDGIYWMPFRATEERCNQLLKTKRRAGRCIFANPVEKVRHNYLVHAVFPIRLADPGTIVQRWHLLDAIQSH
jgi:hypothetical protein